MKKSTIWILTIVMALTFGVLLYFQLMYLENMVKMRREQFSDNVMRSLYATSNYLERMETLHYLSEETEAMESSLYSGDTDLEEGNVMHYSVQSPDGTVSNFTLSRQKDLPSRIKAPEAVQSIGDRYQNIHEMLRGQFLYQRGLLNEVILTILRDAGTRPAIERADSAVINNYLEQELANNGLDVPFRFALTNKSGDIFYETPGFSELDPKLIYSQVLFPNSDTKYYLKVGFPTRSNYVFSSVRFIIPSMAFTMVLLLVFLFTIIFAFRQKRISQMKTDFINNMTHELKTPVSTISLAAQMLADNSVPKSESSLKHLSSVINDESKRLKMLIDKVLQLSVFDNTDAMSAMQFRETDVNQVISSVASAFKIKVESFSGHMVTDLKATRSLVYVDKMEFTNVIFNLLDNAVKYRREDEPPVLEITTRDLPQRKIQIEVKDNGIGIRKDEQKRIFERFYRVSTGNLHDVKGFGIGLAYVKRMVDLFQGTITVESVVGKYTKFIITLPLAE